MISLCVRVWFIIERTHTYTVAYIIVFIITIIIVIVIALSTFPVRIRPRAVCQPIFSFVCFCPIGTTIAAAKRPGPPRDSKIFLKKKSLTRTRSPLIGRRRRVIAYYVLLVFGTIPLLVQTYRTGGIYRCTWRRPKLFLRTYFRACPVERWRPRTRTDRDRRTGPRSPARGIGFILVDII